MQVLCCASHLELLPVVLSSLLSPPIVVRPSKMPTRFAVFTLKMAAILGWQKLPGILLDPRMSAEKG